MVSGAACRGEGLEDVAYSDARAPLYQGFHYTGRDSLRHRQVILPSFFRAATSAAE